MAQNPIQYSGSFNPLLIVSNKMAEYMEADRLPIGMYDNLSGPTLIWNPEEEEMICLYTDEFIDQFGGEKNKKLNKSNFKDLLLTVKDMTMEEQEAFLEYSLNN